MIHYTLTGPEAGLPFCAAYIVDTEATFQHMGYSGKHPAHLCPVCQKVADAPECTQCDDLQVWDTGMAIYFCPDCK